MGKIDDVLKTGRRKIHLPDYDYFELYGVEAILDFANGKERVGYAVCTGDLFPHQSYGRRWEGAEEALIFTDGSVLLCGTISSWAGTFATHDDIRVEWYGLTPKSVKKSSKGKRRG